MTIEKASSNEWITRQRRAGLVDIKPLTGGPSLLLFQTLLFYIPNWSLQPEVRTRSDGNATPINPRVSKLPYYISFGNITSKMRIPDDNALDPLIQLASNCLD
jgi:hypothetical protein